MTGPVATYRVQMRNGVDFAHLSEHLGYIARLGASHVYLSPVFTARTGSTHGYDVTRPDEIDPALGGLAAFEAFAREAARHGLGIVLDIVPNHMAASVENPWWRDVLEHGRASRYAGFFDIDWEAPPAPGRVALPVLGMPFAEALAAGEIRLVAGPDGPELACHDLRLPLRPESRRRLDGRAPEAVNGDPRALLAVLDEQHYAPVYWRALPDRLNWRRFFDITELVGLRIEQEEVFEAVHRLVFDLVRRGLVHGLRIDHIDGLADPAGYLHRLRARLEACGAGPEFPLWVEKILGPHETLRRSWPVSGTTGYEVLNEILHLLCDGRATRPLDTLWQQVSGDARSFAEVVAEARREVLERLFAGEHARLAAAAAELAAGGPEGRELGAVRLGLALRELLARLPVYRSYAAGGAPEPEDRALLEETVRRASRETGGALADALVFLAERLLSPGDDRERRFAARFEQLSGPLAAKAVEDTAFYRHLRFVAANEVGGEPDPLGLSPARFHARQRARSASHPAGLVPTATHDTKRGADVRARLAVLGEVPSLFAAHVRLWRRMNRAARGRVDGASEHLLYQTLIGVWPLQLAPDDRAGLAALADRVVACMRKSVREAKRRTRWTEPDAVFEAELEDFVRRLLDLDASPAFLADLHGFVERIAPAGAVNGLVQQALAATLPGVPDIYRGSEREDVSLVDPDNRRPVDFAALAAGFDPDARPAGLLPHWRDGRIRQWLLARLLSVRRRHRSAFAGGYRGLRTVGPAARHLVAFERAGAGERLVVAVLRHPFAAGVRAADLAPDPARLAGARLRLSGTTGLHDLVTDRRIAVAEDGVRAAELFAVLPVVVGVPLAGHGRRPRRAVGPTGGRLTAAPR